MNRFARLYLDEDVSVILVFKMATVVTDDGTRAENFVRPTIPGSRRDAPSTAKHTRRSLLGCLNRGESGSVEAKAKDRDAAGSDRELGRPAITCTPDSPEMRRKNAAILTPAAKGIEDVPITAPELFHTVMETVTGMGLGFAMATPVV
jgi:hypothetical protein